MSTLHHGYCTFAVHDENSFVPVFFKVSIDHLFDNLQSGKMNFFQGCKCHDVAPDETCLDCLRSKCNIGRYVGILIVVIFNYIQKHKGDFLTCT